jgi:hypothetical protein
LIFCVIVSNVMARTQKLEKQPALPLRCSYLDTEDLMDRLRNIYGDDKNFKLVMSNDRYILYAVTKLTKDQLKELGEDSAVYAHYQVPGGGHYVGPGNDTR